MTKYVGVAFACLPAVLPDAFSLAIEWTVFGVLVSGAALIAYWKLPALRSIVPADKRDEAVFLLSAIFVSCFVMFGYRAVSGVTFTAAYAQDVGSTLAAAVGTEERFNAMTEELRTRLEALERLAALESQLQEAERRAQDAERAAAQSERDKQEAEREAAEAERDRQEVERQLSAAARLAEEKDRQLEAKERELQKAYRDAEAAKSAQAVDYVDLTPRSTWFELETDLSDDDLGELTRADIDELVLVNDLVEVLISTGIERELELEVDFRDLDGNVLASAKGSTSKRDYTKIAEDVYEADVGLKATLPASAAKPGVYVWCVRARDNQGGQTWSDGAAEEYIVVQRGELPTSMENTYDEFGEAVDVEAICG